MKTFDENLSTSIEDLEEETSHFVNRRSIVSRIDQSEWKNSSRSSSIEFERVKTFADLLS